jgi:hypothetical protein
MLSRAVTTRLSDIGRQDLLSPSVRSKGDTKKVSGNFRSAAQHLYTTFSEADGFSLFSSVSLTPRKNQNRFFCVRKINNTVMFHKS